MMKGFIFTLVCCLCSVGCTTTPKADLSRFTTAGKPLYPMIIVVATSEQLQYFQHRNAFLQALEESSVFESVEIGNPYADFALEVNLTTKNLSMENNAVGFTKAVIFGTSLGLIPINVIFETRGRIRLRHKGMIFDEFEVFSEFRTNASILNMNSKDSGITGAYRRTVEEILEQIQARGSFDKFLPQNNIKFDRPSATI